MLKCVLAGSVAQLVRALHSHCRGQRFKSSQVYYYIVVFFQKCYTVLIVLICFYMAQIIKEDTLVGEIIKEWTIQEYERHERGILWYAIMGGLGLFFVIYGVITSDFLFSLIIILFAIILFLQAHQEPKQILFQITELGVVVGNRFYSFSELESFFLIYNPPHVKTLFLEAKGTLKPMIRVPLLDMNPVEVKNVLRAYLPENFEREEEPLSDRAARNWQIH